MRKIVILPSFERSLKKLVPQEKKQTTESLELFNSMLISGYFPTCRQAGVPEKT